MSTYYQYLTVDRTNLTELLPLQVVPGAVTKMTEAMVIINQRQRGGQTNKN